ncbi:polysaccharide biosynthesis tyrosine autokinase [Phragmitibacter flavus]|uniref:Polysaccharide biosynthesis tyrosine autokinase n=1 Tax=Phragmitibacter flavus TaxID=2576071 RepID=A0A5R8KA81_9BACT|nr:polysaccharide biosynthesis tyrosine autokinase [Phragmitibacter flavus]TLD68439.1 polysaccharide biosynthesis tyrosine autokinase [Phragmitibacter flavus]
MRKSPASSRKIQYDSTTAFTYSDIFHVLRDKAWLIVLCLLVAAFIVAAMLVRSVPLYQSRVVVQVEQSETKVLDSVQEVNPQDLRMNDLLATIMENLKNRDLLLRVVRRAELGKDMTFPEVRDYIMTEPELVDALESEIDITIRKGTRLIEVSVEDQVPERAQKIAGMLIEESIGQNIESRANAGTLANEFLAAESKRLAKALADSELALQNYKDERQAVSLEEKQNIVTEKLRDLNVRLTQSKTDRIRLENDREQVKTAGNDLYKLLSIPSIANQRAVAELRSQISLAESEMANLSQRYRPKHPRFIQMQDRLKDLQRSQLENIALAAEGMENAYNSALATEQKVAQGLAEQERLALDLGKIAIEYNALARDVESNQALYASVQKRLKETDITRTIEFAPWRVVETPQVAEDPSKPRKMRTWLIGLGVGLVFGLALAFGIHAFDDTLRTVDQAEAATDVPVIAALPQSSKFKSPAHSLVMVKDPNSPIAESFRILRSSLELMEDHDKDEVVLFTSSIPSEGKSFCSANYAISSANLGKRTLLIDADLRRPMVNELFFKGRVSVGLADVLQGKVTLEEALHVSNTENLFILSAGTEIRNPAELLASPALAEFFDSLKGKFDRVVLDTAPIHAVSDTLHMVSFCKFVCLVARCSKTPRKAVIRAAQMLEEAGKAPSGIILNMLPARRNSGLYYHYYSGSYGKPVYGKPVAS